MMIDEHEHPSTDDERVARLMAMVSPLGYASALALLEAETKMLAEANIARNRGPLTEAERNAIRGVLWNASNYPEAVQARMLGRDTTPLAVKVIAAVESARGAR